MTPRRINSDGRKLIQSFESLRLAAYHGAADRPGLYTIGWGHTGTVEGRPVAPAMKITAAQADALLDADLEGFEAAVERLAPGAADCEFAAMVSLCFNIGTRGFQGSSVRRLHLLLGAHILRCRNAAGAGAQARGCQHQRSSRHLQVALVGNLGPQRWVVNSQQLHQGRDQRRLCDQQPGHPLHEIGLSGG